MSDEFNDGGPAFPWGEHGSRLGGMSLRDWFAGQALIANGRLPFKTIADEARFAYRVADAMLAARQRAEAENA